MIVSGIETDTMYTGVLPFHARIPVEHCISPCFFKHYRIIIFHTEEPMIVVENVVKKFGAFTAVNGLSIEVKPGELYGFLGPNGAGKTTTIKMVTGLFAATSGRVLIDGHDIQKSPLEAKINTGYVPDQPFLYEKLTGREILYFTAGLHRVNHGTTDARIAEVVEMLEIGPWMDRRVEDYSQGMRQRTVIASALLHRPKVLVVDEPMVGLDPRSAHLVKKIFRRQVEEEGAAFLLTTHSLDVAEQLCDRIGIIKDGKLIFEDTAKALAAYKKTPDATFESVFLELTK